MKCHDRNVLGLQCVDLLDIWNCDLYLLRVLLFPSTWLVSFIRFIAWGQASLSMGYFDVQVFSMILVLNFCHICIAFRIVLHHFWALSCYISETESTQSVVQIVGILSYNGEESRLCRREELELKRTKSWRNKQQESLELCRTLVPEPTLRCRIKLWRKVMRRRECRSGSAYADA